MYTHDLTDVVVSDILLVVPLNMAALIIEVMDYTDTVSYPC